MIASIRNSRAKQSLFAIAFAFAFIARILVPVGFMPATGSHGLVLELCSQSAGKVVVLDVEHKVPDQKPPSSQPHCVFATGLGHGLLAPAETADIQPLLGILPIRDGEYPDDGAVVGLAAPPPPSRGPPALS